MTRSNFLIEYEVVDNRGAVIKSGTIKAKNKLSKFDAMAGLDNHLKKTVPGFYKMNVKSCRDESMSNFFEDLMKGFQP